MTNLIPEKTPDFESLGKIQDVIGLNKKFVIENASTLPMVNYKGDMARIIVTFNKKSLSVHSSSQAVVSDIKDMINHGLPSVNESSNDNSSKVSLISYKTDNGTGYKFNYE
jgi:hypothetical protein